MSILRYPYIKYLVTPRNVAPAQHAYRPVIPVRISHGSNAVTFDSLIDSGADECTFPGWVAKTIGIDVFSGRQRIFSGIGGSVLSYRHRTHLRIADVDFCVDAFYSHEWDNMPFGLLGQAGFFANFGVTFDYASKQITLSAHS